MNYLKNVYLAKGINHTNGQINRLVMVDGALVGGFIFSQTRFGDKTRWLYLLSDFSISRERKLSKLVALMATSGEVIDPINRQYLIKVQWIETTAFTGKAEKLAALGITKPKYEELTIVFLPEDKNAFIELLARIEASKKAQQIIAGSLADFNALFEAIVRVKQEKNVINNAVALRLLAELAVSALDAEKIVPEQNSQQAA